MKSVRLYGKHDIRFEIVPPPPPPGGSEVLLRVDAAGICGSDMHNFATGRWISRVPSIPGHELAGEVLAVGPDVSGLKPGDRVVSDSRVWCGACPACMAGEHHLCHSLGFVGEVCDGGFAERVTLPERLLLKHDHGVPAAVAATAEPLAVALHAVARLAPAAGVPVLVTGCGMIGALSAVVLSRLGQGPVFIADRNAGRAALVAEVTGAQVIDLTDTSQPAIGGVVEATGSASVLKRALDLALAGSSIALVGIFHGGLDFDPTILVERELSLIGCHAFRDELPEAVARLPQLASAIARLIDTSHHLEDVPDAYRAIMSGAAVKPKTIIRCS